MLNHRAKVDTLPIGLLSALSPPQEFIWRRMWNDRNKKGSFERDFERIRDQFLARMRGFAPKERAAILSFLEAYEQLFPDDVVEPRLLREAIKYWRTRILPSWAKIKEELL
jgi:hypothetical protein